MIFGIVMHLRPLYLMGNQKFKNFKSNVADGVILKIEKSQYLRNRLADFDEILHDGTY